MNKKTIHTLAQIVSSNLKVTGRLEVARQGMFAFFLFCFCFLHAQQDTLPKNTGRSYELTVHRGKIIKHSPKIAYAIPAQSYGLSFNILQRKRGISAWEIKSNYPNMGLLFHYYHFGDKSILGDAIGLVPNMDFTLFKSKKLHGEARVASGVFYLTKHYDALQNPTNNAIGSSFNGIVLLELMLHYRLTENWQIRAGGSFTHTSNGATVLPNLGINIPAFALGLRYTPQPLVANDFLKQTGNSSQQKWAFGFTYRMAYRENIRPGGPQLPMYNPAFQSIWQASTVWRIHLGGDYEFHQSTYQFSLHSYATFDEQEARKAASRWSVSSAAEARFGVVGIYLGFGYYFSKSSEGLIAPYYNRLAVRYYFKPLINDKIELNLGIYLKAHKAVAEYFSLGLEANFLP